MRALSHREAEPGPEREFWTGVQVLLGLRFDQDEAASLLQEVFEMLDLRVSSTYQAILEEGKAEGIAEGKAEGKAEGARRFLLRAGSHRLGTPGAEILARIEAIASEEALDHLADRLFEVETWEDLLA